MEHFAPVICVIGAVELEGSVCVGCAGCLSWPSPSEQAWWGMRRSHGS